MGWEGVKKFKITIQVDEQWGAGKKEKSRGKKKIEKEVGIGWKVVGFVLEVSVLKLE